MRDLGLRVGLAANPDTPFEALAPYLDQVDLVLCMTVFPGFGGQSFIAAEPSLSISGETSQCAVGQTFKDLVRPLIGDEHVPVGGNCQGFGAVQRHSRLANRG